MDITDEYEQSLGLAIEQDFNNVDDRLIFRDRIRAAVTALEAKMLPMEPAHPLMEASEYHRHGNGGGVVSNSADVSEDAYVGPHARVLGRAHVIGRAWIGHQATIQNDAHVFGSAIIGGHSTIADHATVQHDAIVIGSASVIHMATVETASTIINGNICGNARVTDRAVVFGCVSGFATIKNETIIRGSAEVFGRAVIDGGDWHASPICIVGSRWAVVNSEPGYISIGCTKEKFGDFERHAAAYKRTEDMTDAQVEEYRAYVRLIEEFGQGFPRQFVPMDIDGLFKPKETAAE
jgi:UDP-3-O-[3-hydroxymyristoyl] glucosamine N-acyltransferase